MTVDAAFQRATDMIKRGKIITANDVENLVYSVYLEGVEVGRRLTWEALKSQVEANLKDFSPPIPKL